MDAKEAVELEEILLNLQHEQNLPEINRVVEILTPIFENERKKQRKRSLNLNTAQIGFDPKRETSKAVQVFSNSISIYEKTEQNLEILNGYEQDILHALELTDIPDDEMVNLMHELRKIRIERRVCKNFLRMAYPLYSYAIKNKDIAKQLERVASEVDQADNNIKQAAYMPREKTSLQMAFQKARPFAERAHEYLSS